MVCNYGIGVPAKTTCDEELSVEDSNRTPFITYYPATSEVIEDVKKCLKAVRCRHRQLSLFDDDNGPCSGTVESCLKGRSGLRFIQPSQLRSIARSDDSPIDIEASRCKIDTILCSINASFACQERIRRCLPLLDLFDDDGVETTARYDRRPPIQECECAEDLILSDGNRGGCGEWQEDGEEIADEPSCLVKSSPCVVLGPAGVIEVSVPTKKLNGMVHRSFQLCKLSDQV